jgi:hypothetical protein
MPTAITTLPPSSRNRRTPGPAALPTVKPFNSFATPTPFPARAFTAVIHGTVTDQKTGSPIAGALISVGQLPRHVTRTNAFGRYRITFPAGPPVSVQVSAPGYAGALAMGALHPHRAFALNFRLPRETASNPAAPPSPFMFGNGTP